jgi:hypothetical protein
MLIFSGRSFGVTRVTQLSECQGDTYQSKGRKRFNQKDIGTELKDEPGSADIFSKLKVRKKQLPERSLIE